MKISKFYHCWGYARAMLLLAFIGLTIFSAFFCWGYTLEMDYMGPGSIYDQSMEQYRDQENKDAADKCSTGTCSEREQEQSRD